jgi:hypothetical protein
MKYQKSNFKSIGNLIEPLVRKHTQVNIISHAKLLNIWETIVGEDISKKAKPLRIKTVKGGQENILFLGMKGPYMAELSLQKESIIDKINSYFSKKVIAYIKLQVVHDFSSKNVIDIGSSKNSESMKGDDTKDTKFGIAHLEKALINLKNNLNNSRKKK